MRGRGLGLPGGWLRFQEFKRPRDESVVVLEDPAVSGVGVEGFEFALGQSGRQVD
ncbi:hypothetical protein GCM10010345_33650 [Streptomyces canarius]|uniref:Uncharacterized protein n=1 Tax=Streptomyces canarius TaxID=285453 RepID=A0ABQ3CLA4_9ACTN|nr:hypothetical protein GCM10010345_33650 [Streptomyces canarius]